MIEREIFRQLATAGGEGAPLAFLTKVSQAPDYRVLKTSHGGGPLLVEAFGLRWDVEGGCCYPMDPLPEEWEKAVRRAFAQAQIDRLVEMGFPRRSAVAIMRAAGPGRALQAVEWGRYALGVIPSVDALDCLLSGAGGTNGFGRARMAAVLQAFGLKPPEVSSSTALFGVLNGAREAVLAGIPEREPVEE